MFCQDFYCRFSHLTTPRLLQEAAQCRGVQPSASGALTSQPNSTKSLTTSKCPAQIALCKAVIPSSLEADGLWIWKILNFLIYSWLKYGIREDFLPALQLFSLLQAHLQVRHQVTMQEAQMWSTFLKTLSNPVLF